MAKGKMEKLIVSGHLHPSRPNISPNRAINQALQQKTTVDRGGFCLIETLNEESSIADSL
jgi:hypothetical protein